MKPRAALAALAALGLAGCAAVPPPIADNEACLVRLTQRQIPLERLADFGAPGDCGVQDGVRLGRGTVAWSRPAMLTCGTAEAIVTFEAEVMQPLAHALFKQPVTKLHHMGTYSCRKRNGKSVGRLSEHAFGRAIDIRSFELADGTVIDVGRDWFRAGRKSEFLRTLAQRACDRFAVVLSPSHDHAHRDHLHLDTGPYRLCGA